MYPAPPPLSQGGTAKKLCWLSPPCDSGAASRAPLENVPMPLGGRALKSRDTPPLPYSISYWIFLFVRQESGRELARDMKRKMVKRKKTRIEEKLDKAKEKVRWPVRAMPNGGSLSLYLLKKKYFSLYFVTLKRTPKRTPYLGSGPCLTFRHCTVIFRYMLVHALWP